MLHSNLGLGYVLLEPEVNYMVDLSILMAGYKKDNSGLLVSVYGSDTD